MAYDEGLAQRVQKASLIVRVGPDGYTEAKIKPPRGSLISPAGR
jgi:hypothetical protein